MSDFFEKIATLVNAQVNDILGKNPKSPLARIKLNAADAEKNPKRSARALRQRLDEALEYEDTLEAKVQALMNEAMELDKEVDGLLRAGDKTGARRRQEQLNMKQRQLAIAESELRDHRRVTRHLLQELGGLEGALQAGPRRPAAPRIPRTRSRPAWPSGPGGK